MTTERNIHDEVYWSKEQQEAKETKMTKDGIDLEISVIEQDAIDRMLEKVPIDELVRDYLGDGKAERLEHLYEAQDKLDKEVTEMTEKTGLSITHGTLGVTITLLGRRRSGEVYGDTVRLTPPEWDKVIRALRTTAARDNNYAGVLVKLDL